MFFATIAVIVENNIFWVVVFFFVPLTLNGVLTMMCTHCCAFQMSVNVISTNSMTVISRTMFSPPAENRTLFSAVKERYSKPMNYRGLVAPTRFELVPHGLRIRYREPLDHGAVVPFCSTVGSAWCVHQGRVRNENGH